LTLTLPGPKRRRGRGPGVDVALAVGVAQPTSDLSGNDGSRLLGVVDEQAFIQGKTLPVRIVSMLVRMIQ